MKKIIIFLTVTALLLTACSKPAESAQDSLTASDSAVTETAESTAAADSTASSADNTESKPQLTPPPEKEYDEIIEISTPQQLVDMSREYGMDIQGNRNKLYILTDDINMAGVEGFVPIGKMPPYEPDPVNGFPPAYVNHTEPVFGFVSTFDGQGHTIKNLTLTYEGNAEGKKGDMYAGFFYIVNGGTVKNLNIENITIDGIGRNAFHNSGCGALAGHFGGYAENCHVSGKISAIECSGGFVGRIRDDAQIYNCTADVDISGCWYTAGFIGYSDGGDDIYLKDCASFGSVTAFIPSMYLDSIRDVGGFGGHMYGGTFENCHAQTELIILDPAVSVGGIFGFANQNTTEFINCSYHPDYTGNWELLFSVNHVNCNGDYSPYSFTADTNRRKSDYIKAIHGIDSCLIEAESKDNRYIIYESDGWGAADGGERAFTLKDTATGKEKPLGKVWISRNSGAGFFQNGDVYIFDERMGLKIFTTDMNNFSPVFESSTNFPCGDNIDGNGTERYLFAIRRDPEKMDYIVIYGEFTSAESSREKHPYRVGLLDKNGNLVQTHTLPCEFYSIDFYGVHMFKSGETEIEFYTEMKDKEIFRGHFDFSNSKYTAL